MISLLYFIKVNLVLAALVLFYIALLKRDRAFGRNRLYLLVMPAVAVLLPLIVPPGSGVGAVEFLLDEIVVSTIPRMDTLLFAPAAATPIFKLYLLAASVPLLLLLTRLASTLYLIAKGDQAKQGTVVRLRYAKPTPVFSFFHFVHVPDHLSSADQKALMRHELAHVQLGHSADILYFQLLGVLLWLNPFVWLAMRELRAVHEFQADEQARAHHHDYSSLLVEQALLGAAPALAHPFSTHSTLKTRIVMLHKTKSRFAVVRLALLIPLVGLLVAAVNPGASSPAYANTSAHGDEEVDVMPKFPGGMPALMEWMISHVHYPKEAANNDITGKVVVGFLVDKTGAVTNVTIKESVHPKLDNEALRVVKAMPKWTPGSKDGKAVPVEMALPVRFDLPPPPPPAPPVPPAKIEGAEAH